MSSGSLSVSGFNKKVSGRDKTLPRSAALSHDKESSPQGHSEKGQMKKCSEFVESSPLYSTSTEASSCEQSSLDFKQLDNRTKEALDLEEEFTGQVEFPSMSKATFENQCKDTLFGEMLPNPMPQNITTPAICTREKPQQVEAPKIPDNPISSHTSAKKDWLPRNSLRQESSAVKNTLSLVTGTLPTVGGPQSKAQSIHSMTQGDLGGDLVGKGGVSTDGRSSSHATVRKKFHLDACPPYKPLQSTQEDPQVYDLFQLLHSLFYSFSQM